MKIYTNFKNDKAAHVTQKKLANDSLVRWTSGSQPLDSKQAHKKGLIYFNGQELFRSVSTSEVNMYKKVSNAEFVRLIAKELPKTKPVPLSKMTKAQLLKVIEKNAKGCSDTTRALVSEKQTLESLLSESGQKLSEAETHNDELQTEIDSLKEHLEGAKQGLANAKDEGGQFREGCIRKDLEKAAVQDELSNLKKNIMLLSGVAMGVKV